MSKQVQKEPRVESIINHVGIEFLAITCPFCSVTSIRRKLAISHSGVTCLGCTAVHKLGDNGCVSVVGDLGD